MGADITPSQEKFTRKQQAFIVEYCIDKNGTQAAIRAGYSANSAGAIACELLKNPKVSQAIDIELGSALDRARLSVDQVVSDLIEVKEMSMGRKPVAKVITTKEGECIPLQVHEVNVAGANKSLELLGKHLGMFEDTSKRSDAAEIISAFFAGVGSTMGLPVQHGRVIEQNRPPVLAHVQQTDAG